MFLIGADEPALGAVHAARRAARGVRGRSSCSRAGRAGTRTRASAERFDTFAFAVLLVAAVYTIVLVISAAFTYPSRSTDMVTIVLVICGFFALLLFAFFVIVEWIPAEAVASRRASSSRGRRNA